MQSRLQATLADFVPSLRVVPPERVAEYLGHPDLPDAWWLTMPVTSAVHKFDATDLSDRLADLAYTELSHLRLGDLLPSAWLARNDFRVTHWPDEVRMKVLVRAPDWSDLLSTTVREISQWTQVGTSTVRPVVAQLFAEVIGLLPGDDDGDGDREADAAWDGHADENQDSAGSADLLMSDDAWDDAAALEDVLEPVRAPEPPTDELATVIRWLAAEAPDVPLMSELTRVTLETVGVVGTHEAPPEVRDALERLAPLVPDGLLTVHRNNVDDEPAGEQNAEDDDPYADHDSAFPRIPHEVLAEALPEDLTVLALAEGVPGDEDDAYEAPHTRHAVMLRKKKTDGDSEDAAAEPDDDPMTAVLRAAPRPDAGAPDTEREAAPRADVRQPGLMLPPRADDHRPGFGLRSDGGTLVDRPAASVPETDEADLTMIAPSPAPLAAEPEEPQDAPDMADMTMLAPSGPALQDPGPADMTMLAPSGPALEAEDMTMIAPSSSPAPEPTPDPDEDRPKTRRPSLRRPRNADASSADAQPADAGAPAGAPGLPEALGSWFAGCDPRWRTIARDRLFSDNPRELSSLGADFDADSSEVEALERDVRAHLDAMLATPDGQRVGEHLAYIRSRLAAVSTVAELRGLDERHLAAVPGLGLQVWQVLRGLLGWHTSADGWLTEAPTGDISARTEQAVAAATAHGPVPLAALRDDLASIGVRPEVQAAWLGRLDSFDIEHGRVVPRVGTVIAPAVVVDPGPQEPVRDPGTEARCFRDDTGTWTYRYDVTPASHGGGPVALPEGFAATLGLRPGGRTTLQHTAGPVELAWDADGPHITALGHVLGELGSADGDMVFLSHGPGGRLGTRPLAADTHVRMPRWARALRHTGVDPVPDQVNLPVLLGARVGLPEGTDLKAVLTRLQERGDADLLELLGIAGR